jgi:lipopolysaccharide export LptBFGC system permease protein LptF
MDERMYGVNFAEYYKNGRIKTDYIAPEGEWTGTAQDPRWKLLKVTLYRYDDQTGCPIDENGDGIIDYPKSFDEVEIRTSLTPADVERKELHTEFLPYARLRARAIQYPNLPEIKIQMQQRMTIPLVTVLLLLLGMPFVLYQESKSMFIGIGIALLVCAAFFVTSFIFQDLGNKRFIQPIMASWSPIVLFGSAGLCLFFGTIRT